jgi:hypothetical protein
MERIEQSPAGRVLLSVFIVVVLIGIVVVNLPASKLKSKASDATEPVVNALGLNQNWDVFAPDPRRESIALEARVTFTDGSHETWHPYVGGDLVGSYRDYRWGKWVENVRLDRNRKLWRGTAGWVARRASHEDRRVRRVVLVRRWREVQPPGAPVSQGPWRQYLFYERAWGGRGA